MAKQNQYRIEAEQLKANILAVGELAKSENRELTDAEYGQVIDWKTDYDAKDAKAAQIEKAKSALAELANPDAVSARRGLDPEDFDYDRDELAYGKNFVNGAAFKSFRKAHPNGVSNSSRGGASSPIQIETTHVGAMDGLFSKATIGLETGGSPATTFQNPQRLATIDYLGPEDLGILDLISRAQMSTNLIEYLQIIGVTENAAIVVPGALKPLSDFETDIADARAYTYADGFAVTNQSLADEPFLASYLQARLPRHLRNELQRVLLAGAGTGGEPAGILNTTGTQSQAWVATSGAPATDLLETISFAFEKIDDVDGENQGIAMSPTDYWRLMRLKDLQGRYYSQGPWSTGPGTVWGVPVRKVKRLAAGVALAGEFSTITLLDREGVSVAAFNQHEDYARRNLTYVRAELRAGLAIFEPTKLIEIDLTAA